MKKVFVYIFMLMVAVSLQAVPVTFQVDMSNQSVSPQGVHIAGDFNGWSPSATLMTLIGNNVYSVTLSVNASTTYQYKFINGDTWAGEETVPAACGVSNGMGGYNREVVVGTSNMTVPVVCFSQCGPCQPTTVELTLQVDMSQQTVSPQGVHVVGSFNNWSTTETPMTLIGNNVYSATLTVNASTTYQYKFINGDTWAGEETVPEACGVSNGMGGYNREVVVGTSNMTVPVVCFSQCGPCPGMINLTLQVDMGMQNVSPDGVHVAGSFNNWSTTATALNNSGGTVYTVTFAVVEDSVYEYVFINGDEWSEKEEVPEQCGVPNGTGGFNRQVIVSNTNQTVPVVCFGWCEACPPLVNVTFRVDMSLETVSPDGVHLVGDFQGWDPGATPMMLSIDNIWEVSLLLYQGEAYQYKFINGNTWEGEEIVPEACGVPNGMGGFNRQVIVGSNPMILDAVCFSQCGLCPVSHNVVFRVDMSEQTVSPLGVHIAGNFQEWDPASTQMTLAGSGVYEYQTSIMPGELVEYLFVNGNTWDDAEVVPEACGTPNGMGGFNRYFTMPLSDTILNVVCFSSCDPCQEDTLREVIFYVDMRFQNVSPNGVHLAGSFQGWDPSSTPMEYEGGSLYSKSILLNANEYIEYKFINGDTWDGAEEVSEYCGVPNGMGGFNRYLTVPTSDTALPYYCFSSCFPCLIGIEETLSFKNPEIIYHPSLHQIFIDYTSPDYMDIQLQMFNSSGQLISAHSLPCQKGINHFQIDLPLYHGLCIVMLATEKGEIYSSKFILP